MARILNVEHSRYLNNVIDIYQKNRVGQYSKFLSSQPVFVTYFHRNMVLSRQDAGSGSIESELGERSPIRFNRIANFPIYNVPQLNPQNVYDDTGYDIELEFSDAGILPNTIKPHEGDYFIIQYPGSKEYLFRVNRFDYNTIQSNDFYKIDCDIRRVGTNLEEQYVATQIVERYITVFDNIGTEDKCFLKEEDIDYINGLGRLFYELRDWYKNAFYIRDLNTFTFQTGRYSEFATPIYRYDAYLEKFIMDSNIFFDENSENALVFSPASPLQDRFNFVFNTTLYAAILNNNLDYLRPYEYIVTHVITKPTSIFNINQYFGEDTYLYTYKDKQPSRRKQGSQCCCCTSTIAEKNGSEIWYDINPNPKCTPTWDLSDGIEYFSSKFLNAILCKKIETKDYFELIIFNFLHNINMKFNRKFIIDSLEFDERTFYYLPLIIYILSVHYRNYFISEKEIEV